MFPPPFFCWSKNIIFDKIQISTTFLFGRSRLSHLTGVFQEVAVLELLNAWDLMDTNTSQRFFRRRVLPVTAELGKGTAVSSGQGFPDRSDGREREVCEFTRAMKITQRCLGYIGDYTI